MLSDEKIDEGTYIKLIHILETRYKERLDKLDTKKSVTNIKKPFGTSEFQFTEKQNKSKDILFEQSCNAVKLEAIHTKKHKMVELKARVDDQNIFKKKLSDLGAKYFGTFHQKDQYFVVPEGRLKLRTVEGKNIVELIYYERENLSRPKIDDAYIVRVFEADKLNVILKKILRPLNVIEKDRDVYQYDGTEIHLDTVTNLGNFVEFERQTSSNQKNFNKDIQVLEKLIKALEISPNNLVAFSYSDLLEK